jgi:dethiobiotin synthetase
MPVPSSAMSNIPAFRSLFVTGTDTGVGKTVAASALVHRLRREGLRVAGMKPVASGCERMSNGLRNEDALALQAASAPRPDYADVNPYALEIPTAPQLAARAAGIRVDPVVLLAAHARLAARADVVVVEGAGGWLAPMDDGLDQGDFARAIEAPVVLVVGLRLGCLSHARLSARAIVDDGFALIGWIGNTVDPAFAERDAYVDLLRDALPAPCLGVLPFAPGEDAAAMAEWLSLPDAARRPLPRAGED